MPAVKVFNIFGGQKPTDKHTPTTPPAQGALQKFYRTFSVGSEPSPEHKGSKVTAIAACIERKISDPVKINSDNVQKFLSKVNINNSVVNSNTDCSAPSRHVYENINIAADSNAVQQDKLLEETKGYSSIYENVIVMKTASDTSAESKLNKALESFDKILSEFTSSTSLTTDGKCSRSIFIPPKLQKSKTCSIIESRCILKKSNSGPDSDNITRNKVVRNNSIDKTTSLWNLADMKGKELTSPLVPLTSTANDKANHDKYATYKISSKNTSRSNGIHVEDLKKLDVKTRILKKTLSNPPSTPVPVVSKTKPLAKKAEKKVIDPKKIKTKTCTDNGSLNIKIRLESKEIPKSQLQKAKSVWEIGNETLIVPGLERTKSTTSIAGSPSKIPVIRSQMSHNKFSSTRALFSPTPVDLSNVDQASECAQKKKSLAPRKNNEKLDGNKQIRQKSLLNLKSEVKRQNDRTKKEPVDSKKPLLSSKSNLKDYSDEIKVVRAKLQHRIINRREIPPEVKQNKNDSEKNDVILSPVKSIVKKLELKTAREMKTEFISCKVFPPVHKELCVANTTFHNHLSTLVGRQIKYVGSQNDSKTCSQVEKLALDKQADEKISDTHSDCSDDSGHVSNDAVHDNDQTFDNVHDLSPVHTSVDEVDFKVFDGPKQFGIELSENAKSVRPVRPARRSGRGNEVASGTRATDVPKVDEQIMFRGGVVGELDARRDAALARVLVRLQARARGLLARRRAQRLRTQHTAARCVQRNVRAFLAVRDWPWWRLLVRVTPLLAVHRTEHRLKQAQDELETLKSKLDKVENERTHYKNESERLETKFPSTEDEWLAIAQDFENNWNFPHCTGSIDGKHVRVVARGNSGSLLYNYKGYHSIVLMEAAAVNARYEFITVNVGCNGRISDGGVIANTKFYQLLTKGKLRLPPPEKVNNGNKELPYVFIGDEAFALRSDFLKPYSAISLDHSRRIYNYRLSRARRVVENAFGILSNRFRVYHTPIQVCNTANINSIVLATCVLHNYLLRKASHTVTQNEYDRENIATGEIISGARPNENMVNLPHSQQRNSSEMAKRIRDDFKDYFNNEGAVEWQERMV